MPEHAAGAREDSPRRFSGASPLHQHSPELGGERKRVTVMFADIAGFTSLSETLDPEAVRDLINACFGRLVPVVERYGGTVDKFIGDEIMALFGAPVAHENDPERALRAALGMHEALAAFNAERGTDVRIHFGINTGLVIAGGIGTAGRQDYSVIGDAINLGSRLAGASQRDEILVGPDTYRLTSHLFEFAAAGPLKLEGKAEPVSPYRLLSARTLAPQPRALEARGISSPLVGRDPEVAALTGAVERLRRGDGGIVVLLAEAGIGKSRLVAEVRRQVSGDGLVWLEGRALSFGQNISYWPFIELVQADVGITIDDDMVTRWAKLERRMEALFGDEASEFLPYMATLLSLEVPEELAGRVNYLSGEAMGRQVFRSVRRLVARMAEQHPSVLVFEDLHWADQSSAALLEHLLPLVREVPLLICGVGRPDLDTPAVGLGEVAARDYAERYTQIALSPLTPAESDRLVHNLVPVDVLPPRVKETLLSKAEGNPFFLEEVVRALIDLGGLMRDKASGRWELTARAEEIAMPDTLHGVIMARIDRLDEELKEVLRLAAVVGRSFFYRVLMGLADADRELDRRLEELQGLELVREKARLPELEYIFKHALVQEATYESILLQRRRELHERVAKCIEALFADRLDEFHGLLAYHYTKAEDWAKAQEFLFKAADQAGRIAADAEALSHYEQAMAAYARAFGDKWDSFERAVLERKVGEALHRRGSPQAREHLERQLALLGVQYPKSSLATRGRATTNIAFALKVARAFLAHYRRRLLSRWGLLRSHRAREEAEELCRVLRMMAGFLDLVTEPERALLAFFLMLEIAEEGDLKEYVAQWYSVTGYAFSQHVPITALASRYLARGLVLAEQSQEPGAMGVAYMMLGVHEHFALGKSEVGLEHLRRALAPAWQAGDLRLWAMASVGMAAPLRYRGDLAEGLEIAHRVVAVTRDAGDLNGWGYGLTALGQHQDASGALDEATASLRQAVELLMGVPDYLFAIWASGFLGRCLARQGRLDEALAVLNESSALITRFKYRDIHDLHCVTTWTGLAQVCLDAAERAEQAARPGALREAKLACQVALGEAKFDRGEMVVAYRLQGTHEWLSGKAGRARRWWQRSLALAERQGARYELGLTQYEMGKRTSDRVHLERAQAIFAEIGAQFDLAQARELLGRGQGSR